MPSGNVGERTGPADALPRRCVIAGGGAVGMLFAGLLLDSGAQVCVVDVAAVDAGTAAHASAVDHRLRWVRADITKSSPELAAELAAADTVLLAVPASAALAALKPIASIVAPGTLLMDTLSVKGEIATASSVLRRRCEVLSVNPMFAPSLGLDGRPVAAVRISDGPRTAVMLQLVTGSGGRIVEMSAAEHDRVCAITQAMTHAAVLAFGVALAEADLDLDTVIAVAPPPHASLLALLARISAGAPETYWDVQAANPAAGAARASLRRALCRVEELVGADDEAGFGELLGEARTTLGRYFPRYRDACARMFDTALPR